MSKSSTETLNASIVKRWTRWNTSNCGETGRILLGAQARFAEPARFRYSVIVVPNIDLPDFFQKVLHNNSRLTLILMALGMATWLIGGNVVVMMHYRRLGKSPWSGFRTFAFPFAKFNFKEWCMLVLLAIIALSIMGYAISNQPEI
jgi:xanthine/uracil permease